MMTSHEASRQLTELARRLAKNDPEASAKALRAKEKLVAARHYKKLGLFMPVVCQFLEEYGIDTGPTRPRIRRDAGRPTELSRPIGYKAKK